MYPTFRIRSQQYDTVKNDKLANHYIDFPDRELFDLKCHLEYLFFLLAYHAVSRIYVICLPVIILSAANLESNTNLFCNCAWL